MADVLEGKLKRRLHVASPAYVKTLGQWAASGSERALYLGNRRPRPLILVMVAFQLT